MHILIQKDVHTVTICKIYVHRSAVGTVIYLTITYIKLTPQQVLNPLDAICNKPRRDAVCVSQLRSSRKVDEAILQERPDVKIFLPFRFFFYKPEQLFEPHTYNRFLGKFCVKQLKILIPHTEVFVND